ncbi:MULTISPECIES: chlorophyll a/b-binding protein [Prochlorococcus]|nr:chlorophyll a/b-binding protein [Prochlorococcus marinus]
MSNYWTNYSWFRLAKKFKQFTLNQMDKSQPNYWQNAEMTNGRMAMMGFFALVVNYGLFGWIIPGIF